MAMNYYQLQCFVEVYRTGSLREAGKNLYMSYQGISQNIAKLEKHLGRPLFIRDSNGSVPTDFADYLYEKASVILAQLDAFEQDLLHYGRNNLKLGFIDGIIFSYEISDSLREMMQDEGGQLTNVNLPSTEFKAVKDAILSGQADIAWTFHRKDEKDPQLTYIPIKTSGISLVMHEDDPLAQKEEVSWTDLENKGIVLPREKDCLSSIFRDQCSRFGVELCGLAYTAETQIIEKLAREKHAGALMSDQYLELAFHYNDMVYKKIVPELEVTISIVYANRSLDAETEEMLAKVARKIGASTRYW